METAAPLALDIGLEPERLDDGSPEEQACFGRLTVKAGAADLAGGFDSFVGAYKPGPLVSGYHAAEWLAWNWWRLRYEPRSTASDWWRAHKMTAIGEGYVWPNLTIVSDGVRTALLAEASARPDARPFRYFGAHPVILPSITFEAAVDAFLPRILARLRERDVAETNLEAIWAGVLADRADPVRSRYRRLEALLGRDPDEIHDDTVAQLVADVPVLGEQAVEELAAAGAAGRAPMTAGTMLHIAEREGSTASPRDAARLLPGIRLPRGADVPAWRLGSAAAQALRRAARLGDAPISDARLSELAGVDPEALARSAEDVPFSFALDTENRAQVVLRSRWLTGRRFDLARLLGDRIVARSPDRLHAATPASTYRQKMQRAFAAELLSPFLAVEAALEGDYSEEAQAHVARHFDVSERTVLTLLVNNGRVRRDELDGELGPVAA